MTAGELWRRLLVLLRGDRAVSELDEEMRLHLEMRAEANRERGMSAEEAALASRRRFGNAGVLREQSRDVWGLAWFDQLAQDARYAVRQLRQAPLFALVAVVTIGLCIGINTAVFTLYDTIALRPLPVRDPASLVRVVIPADRANLRELSQAHVDLLERGSRTLTSLVLTSLPQTFIARLPSFSAADERVVTARFVSPDFFAVLGVRADRGRVLAADDEAAAVVSHQFWTRQLHADPAVLGQPIEIHGMRLVIVGVAERAFAGTGLPPSAPDLWTPLAMQPALMPGVDWRQPASRPWHVLARLAPGAGLEQANAELRTLSPQLPERDGVHDTLAVRAATFFQTDAGEFETFAQLNLVLMVAVALILLIGAVNLLNLLAARNAAREREISVRLALGASRSRIARQLCTESVVLGALGGALGLLLSLWLCRWLDAWINSTLIRLSGGFAGVFLDFTPNWRVLAYTAAMSLLVGLLVGLWPAVRASRHDAGALLKGVAGTVRAARGNVLLALQIAGCLVLLAGSGVLVGGAWRSRSIDPGFDARHVAVFDVDVSGVTPDSAAAAVMLREVASRLHEIPGVRAVGWADRSPWIGHRLRTLSGANGARLTLAASAVSPGYFEAIGLRLVSGRAFSDQEFEERAPVLIISEAVARRFFPGTDAVGHSVAGNTPWLMSPDTSVAYTIVGVARDARLTYLSRIDAGYEFFTALPGMRSGVFLVGTTGLPEDSFRRMIAAAGAVNPALPAHVNVVSLVDGPMMLQRMMASAPASVATALALLGLLLASVGLYGLVAHTVTRRTREIGVRIALGAPRTRVLALALRGTMLPVALGAVMGMAGAIGLCAWLARVLATPDAPDLTYGAGAFSPLVFGGVLGVLVLVVVMATIVPARRAASVDPMTALRAE